MVNTLPDASWRAAKPLELQKLDKLTRVSHIILSLLLSPLLQFWPILRSSLESMPPQEKISGDYKRLLFITIGMILCIMFVCRWCSLQRDPITLYSISRAFVGGSKGCQYWTGESIIKIQYEIVIIQDTVNIYLCRRKHWPVEWKTLRCSLQE